MKKTWYFGALLITFTFFGVYQNWFSEPNQEIVLKFADVSVTSDEAQSAIVVVKEQLQSLGIHKIRVRELKDGQLKISYYSTVDVESVKKQLQKDTHQTIGFSSKKSQSLPSKRKAKGYHLDIFEIHKNKDLNSGLDGKYVFNLKQDYDRFYNPNNLFFSNDSDAKTNNDISEVAFKIFKNIALTINKTSGNIPDGRAGPSVLGIV